ncbi:MAG: prepilin-type N-terminal cleavage/methylation domain-containing protein [Desulfuromonas sp.]|nr:prepilin-type N-terminal cleavage/methylation domain-containing protein [Desulfuromonas sp.]
MLMRYSQSFPWRSQCGTSLIEVLIALFLFSVGALAVLQMTIGGFRVNDHARGIDGASNAARSRMELLLGLPYEDLLLIDINADGFAGLAAATADTADFTETVGNYKIYWNVANNPPVSNANNTKTISVIATWSDALGQKQRLAFQTIMVRN